MAAVRHLGFVTRSKYCIVGHFRCPNIVLKFYVDLDPFCSFRDIAISYDGLLAVLTDQGNLGLRMHCIT